jgi:HK97 family phage major capsid protein
MANDEVEMIYAGGNTTITRGDLTLDGSGVTFASGGYFNLNDSATESREPLKASYAVGAARNLRIAETERAWDAPAAQRRIFELSEAQWKRAHLVYDSEAPELRSSYKLPFADVIDGELVAIPNGLRAASRRLPQTDAPQPVLDRARSVLNRYFRDMQSDGKNALKAVASASPDELRVANYIVLFGGRDLEGVKSDRVNADGSTGQFFTKSTALESNYTDTGRLYVDWEHGIGPWIDGDGPGEDDVLGWVDWQTKAVDSRGVWVERVLNRRARYMAELEELIAAGFIGNSSEAVPDRVEFGPDGEIKAWPLKRDTLTVSPMEPRMMSENVFRAAKALGLLQGEDEPEGEPEGGDTGAPAESSEAATAETEAIKSERTMEDEMGENKQPEESGGIPVVQIDYDQMAEAYAKALRAVNLENAAKPAGRVTQDETDRKAEDPGVAPYKSLGEQLMDVHTAWKAGRPPVRLVKANAEAAKAAGLSESVPADGGFLVQQDFVPGLITPDHSVGRVLGLIPANRRMMVSGNSNGVALNGIDETSRVDGSRYGGVTGYWESEGAEKTATKPKFRKINMYLNKVFALAYATDEVLQDASLLTTVVGNAARDELMFKVDDAIIEGTGGGMPQGILISPGLVTVAKEVGQAADTVVAENIVKMWSRRWVSASGYVWFVNQDVTPQLHGLNLPVGTGGALVYMPAGGLSGNPYGTLYGAPVIEIEQASTVGDVGDIILASMEKYLFIDKGGINAASSIHVRFIYDETAFRFVYRCDGQTLNNSALTPFKGTNTVSPFVTLAERA